MSLGHALGQTPPPKSFSNYGLVRISASVTFNGRAQIAITSREQAPFFVSGLTLFLTVPSSSSIVLTSINIDSTGPIQISGTGAASQIVVVPSGLTYGDIVQSMPSYLSFLMMKDPLGNNAIVANGGSACGTNGGSACGIIIILGWAAGTISGSAPLTAIATVVAPSDTIVKMTIS
jgi:hypothetical protein